MDLAEQTKLPLFLHSRNAHAEFIDIIKRNRGRITGGVVSGYRGMFGMKSFKLAVVSSQYCAEPVKCVRLKGHQTYILDMV